MAISVANRKIRLNIADSMHRKYLPFAMLLYLISAIDYALLQTFGDKNHNFFDSKEKP